MTEKKSKMAPMDLSEEVMSRLFSDVADDPQYRPVPGELDQFFNSRVWTCLQRAGEKRIAVLMRHAIDPTITKERHLELCTMIAALRWWLNTRANLFEAQAQRPQAK